MTHELLEQQELPFGEGDRPPPGVDLTAKHVEAEPPDGEVGGRVAIGAPQPGVYTRQELGEGERLGQVVLGAELERVHLRPDVGQRREDHDGQVGLAGQDPPQHGDAIEARHQEIQDHQVIALVQRSFEPRLPVGGDVDHEAFAAQASRHEVQDARLVVDDEHPP